MDPDRAAVGTRLPLPFVATLAAAPLLFLACFYAWPAATLGARALDHAAISRVARSGAVREVVWFTTWQAGISTLATLAVGFAPAYVIARYRFVGRRALVALVTVPFMLPTVVVGAAFTALLPERWRSAVWAIIAAHVFFNIAVVVRVVGAMWTQLPEDLLDAARTLGASPSRVLREVVLPLLRPAILSAAAVVFLFTFTSYGVVQILAGARHPTIEVEIVRRATQLGDVSGAATLAALQLLMLGVLIATLSWLQRRAVPLSLRPRELQRPRTARARAAVGATAASCIVVVGLPMLAMVRSSLRIGDRWTFAAWRLRQDAVRPGASLGIDPLASLGRSMQFAVAATIVSVALGAVASLAIVAMRRRGRLLDVGLMLPLGTSAVTIGLGVLITFDRAPVDWRSSSWLVPVGHALVATPFVIRTVLPVLRTIPEGWRDAAATLGASPLRAWWSIELVVLRRPLLTGAGFAAAISLGEFGATTFLTRSGRETLPIAINRLLGRAGGLPHAQAFVLATILAAVTAAIIVAVESRASTRADDGISS